ncbi:MAG: hypothetical protein MHM6MM_006642 [Cercozoa sp. M6MM]
MKKREAQKEKRDAEKLLEAVYGFAKVTVDKEEDSKQADEATVQQAVQESAVATDKSSKSKHRFWQTQPVPETSRAAAQEDADFEGPIETKDLSEVREEPLKLPPAFVWDSLDLSQESQLEELYALLNRHYVEDDENLFRFDYQRAFLRWALQAPGYRPEWHVAVRIKKTGKLCAFIAAIPCRGAAHDSEFNSVEINFLCVHKKLRAQRLAPVLIKEITRRVNLTDCWQALYTAGVVIPRPVGTAQYFHRLLSPKKLLEVGFSHKPARLTMKAFCRLYSAPSMEACKVPGLRAMTPRDVPQVHRLLNEHLSNFKLRTIFSEEEVSHWLLPRRNVVYSYVKTVTCGLSLLSFWDRPMTRHDTIGTGEFFALIVHESTARKSFFSDPCPLERDRACDSMTRAT